MGQRLKSFKANNIIFSNKIKESFAASNAPNGTGLDSTFYGAS